MGQVALFMVMVWGGCIIVQLQCWAGALLGRYGMGGSYGVGVKVFVCCGVVWWQCGVVAM